MQARLGPQITNVLIKQQDIAKFIAKKLGVPEELIRSDEEMIQAGQQIQQMGAICNNKVLASKTSIKKMLHFIYRVI